MKDRDLLELAAKAMQMEIRFYEGMQVFDGTDLVVVDAHGYPWNPLKENEDAFCLAVTLGVDIFQGTGYRMCESSLGTTSEPDGDDPYAAQRRAIVRAAAEIGEAL